MPVPFLMQVVAPRDEEAKALACSLRDELAAQGWSVTLDGERSGPVGGRPLGILVGRRDLPGTLVVVGFPAADGIRWVAPLPVPDDVATATRATIGFLERWGFIPRVPVIAPQKASA